MGSAHLVNLVQPPAAGKDDLQTADCRARRLDQAGTLKFRVGPTQKQFGERQDAQKVGQIDGEPLMMDDTLYFLPCQSEAEADFILELVRSQPFAELLNAMVFDGEND